MEETTTTTNNSGNNSMMLIVGALVLAAILGYVVFSSARTDNNASEPIATENSDEQMTEEATQDAQMDEPMMNENNMPTGEVQEMPAVESMTLDLNATGTGDMMDTRATNPNVKTFNVEAGSFYFKPNTITVNEGDTVRVVMNSVDMMHDLVIDELGVKLPVTRSGETNTVEFTATKAGTYEFYCSVGQHRQQGQVGTLIVQ